MGSALRRMLRSMLGQDGPDASAVPPEQIVIGLEPTKGWWTGNAKWGGRFVGALPAAQGAVVGITSLDYAPGPPRAMGLNLFRNDFLETAAPALSNSDVRARITYGAGGFSNTFDCDWITGLQLKLFCNSLRVDMVTIVRDATAPYVAGPAVQTLGCTLGINGSSGCICPTLTEPLTSIATGLTAVFPIPDFAKRVTLMSNDNASTVELEFESTNVLLQEVDQATMLVSYLATGVTIPGGAAYIRVRNGTAGTIFIQPVWHLAL